MSEKKDSPFTEVIDDQPKTLSLTVSSNCTSTLCLGEKKTQLCIEKCEPIFLVLAHCTPKLIAFECLHPMCTQVLFEVSK